MKSFITSILLILLTTTTAKAQTLFSGQISETSGSHDLKIELINSHWGSSILSYQDKEVPGLFNRTDCIFLSTHPQINFFVKCSPSFREILTAKQPRYKIVNGPVACPDEAVGVLLKISTEHLDPLEAEAFCILPVSN